MPRFLKSKTCKFDTTISGKSPRRGARPLGCACLFQCETIETVCCFKTRQRCLVAES